MRIRQDIAAVWRIFTRDLRRIARNPVAVLIVIGVCFMPSLYAWYCVAANWDPYQHTDTIAVAVVNEDEGADSAVAGHLEVGDEVVAKLHDNHQLGWTFVDRDDAMRGVESGAYYAAIVIPDDFSADFTSVFEGSFTRPQIDYYVNEKLSAVAPKITDTGATTLEEEINHTFVATVSETVVEMAQKTGTAVEGRADAAEGGLASDLGRTRDALGDTRALLEGLGPTVDAARQAADGARDALATLGDAIPSLTGKLDEAHDQLEALRATVRDYGTRLSTAMASSAVALGAASADARTAIGQSSADLAAARQLTDTALATADQLLADNDALIAQLEPQATADPQLAAALQQLRDEDARLQATVTALQEQSRALADAADAAQSAATALDEAAGQATKSLEDASHALTSTVLPDVDASLDALAEAVGTLRGAVAALAPQLTQAEDTLASLDATLAQAGDAAQLAGASLGATQDQLETTLSDLHALDDAFSVGDLARFLGLDAQDVGSFLAAPVALKTVDVYPVANYGSGVTPFYTNLALWVAGFILMAVLRIRVDPTGLPPFTVTQAYLGRWLLFVALGLAQGLIVCVGDLALGIQCTNPAAFILAGLVTVFVDVNIMFALAYTCRHIGKAIAVILLIMQIPGSSGMYPVEMMPAFFQALNPLLPFTYSIDAMREAIGGMYGMDYWIDLGRLLLFVPVALVLGLVVGRYAFNLNLLFDEKLGQTDLLDSEAAGDGARRERFRLRTVLRVLLQNDAYRAQLTARAERFHRDYPRLIRAGWVLIFAQPLATFAVMVLVKADLDTKLVLLSAMVAGIIAVDLFLIAVEYVNARLASQLQLSSLDPAERLRAAQAAVPGAGATTMAPAQAAQATGVPAPAAAPGSAGSPSPSPDRPDEGRRP